MRDKSVSEKNTTTLHLTMKLRSVLTIMMALLVSLCNAQKIDTSALKLLKLSFDKVKSLSEVSYTTVFIDSSSYGNNPIHLNKIDTVFINKGHSTKLFLFGNGNAKRISKDTLFSYTHSPGRKSSFTTNWDNHELVKYEIENLLGTTPLFVNASVDSIKFNTSNTEGQKYFVIDIIFTKRSFYEGAITGLHRYERIWIDKNTHYPVKRRMFSKVIDDLNVQATDIYEFIVSFTTDRRARQFDMAKFYKTEASESKDEKITEEDILVLGTKAPDFSFIDVKTGKPAKLGDFLNKVVLLDFWYLECPPCRYLMPKLERISKKYADKNVVVLGVNAKDINVNKIETLLQTKGFSYLQYYKPEERMRRLYPLTAFPTTLLLDKKGIIIHKEVGYSEDFEERIGRLVDKEL
jgi:thiol-disulfide isomerase/thioredoxin